MLTLTEVFPRASIKARLDQMRVGFTACIVGVPVTRWSLNAWETRTHGRRTTDIETTIDEILTIDGEFAG